MQQSRFVWTNAGGGVSIASTDCRAAYLGGRRGDWTWTLYPRHGGKMLAMGTASTKQAAMIAAERALSCSRPA